MDLDRSARVDEDGSDESKGFLTFRFDGSRRAAVIAIVVLVLFVYYSFLLTSGHFDLLSPGDPVDLTFNSMAQHLASWRFDVDSTVVGLEGFRRGGRVYAYWGIWPALLRLPLILFGAPWVNVTALSMVFAVSLACAFKLLAVLEIWPVVGGVLGGDLAICFALSGAQIEFLRPRIYDEACVWAGAFGAVFVYCVVRGLRRKEWSGGLLCAMACAAGLALLTRVTVAIGLYAALGLLIGWLWMERRLKGRLREATSEGDFEGRLRTATSKSDLNGANGVWAIVLLAVFAGVAGVVNYYRWGNPFVFADYNLYIGNGDFPDRLPRLHEYGLFNLARIPFGLMYYFVPVWVIQAPDGHFWFDSFANRYMDATELPASSFLLTDPLLIVVALGALVWVVRHRAARFGFPVVSDSVVRLRSHGDVLAVLAGLAVPCVLLFTAISMNYRYRADFYPFLEAAALIGAMMVPRTERPRRLRVGWALVLVGVLASHSTLLLYKISPAGPPFSLMPHGVVEFYQRAWKINLR